MSSSSPAASGIPPRGVYIHGTDPEEQDRLRALNRLTNRRFLEFLRAPAGATVLEVGSGLGLLAADVAAHIPGGKVLGLEAAQEQLAQAPAGIPSLWFVAGDAHAMPCRSGVFDVVYCRYVLEHVADPPGVLREIMRVLRPGGEVFIQENNILVSEFDPACPAFDEVWRCFAQLQERLGGDALIGKKLFRLLQGAGFRDIRLTIAPEVHHAGEETFRPWVVNLVGNVRSAERALIAGGLTTAETISLAYGELERLLERPDASAYFYWNRAQATRP